MAKKKTFSQKMKSRARKGLNRKFEQIVKTYVVDTSAIINRFLPSLVAKGLKGKIIIPNAVMAELENLANKGNEAGFRGLEEVTNLHRLKKKYPISVIFAGQRPDIKHIKYAKSGEIDALIRELAFRNKATLITADLVQAKASQAYGLSILFLRPKIIEKKKKPWFHFFKK